MNWLRFLNFLDWFLKSFLWYFFSVDRLVYTISGNWSLYNFVTRTLVYCVLLEVGRWTFLSLVVQQELIKWRYIFFLLWYYVCQIFSCFIGLLLKIVAVIRTLEILRTGVSWGRLRPEIKAGEIDCRLISLRSWLGRMHRTHLPELIGGE